MRLSIRSKFYQRAEQPPPARAGHLTAMNSTVVAARGRVSSELIVPPCPQNPWYGSSLGVPIFEIESPVRPA